MAPEPVAPFRWNDGERLIVFGRGTVAEAVPLLGEGRYAILTTERAAAAAPDVVAASAAVHFVGPGLVDELAAGLRAAVGGELLVALGGGRVVDTAKALAAADPPRRVAAIPTTLSGAEMTSVHRQATGVDLTAPRVRPAIVINDPALSASQPLGELAASAGNALGHVAEGLVTPLRNPVASLAALESARLMASAFAAGDDRALGQRERDALGLAALLAGYVIGSTWYGLHHVLSQTLVRFAGIGHGPANTIMLQHTLPALARRAPAELERLGVALGEDPPVFARRLASILGPTRLRDAGVQHERLAVCVEQASSRPELAMTPPAAEAAELAALYDAAF